LKILVTGSRGFIGSALVKELQRRGHFVKEFDLILGDDLRKKQHCSKAVKGMEIVIHLAALLEETASLSDLREVNVKGTENLLEASAKERIKQFIFLSTVGVMGGIKQKVSESAPLNPKTKYEKSKAEAEKIVLNSQELLPITILRSAMVLGPNSYWKEIISLIKKGFPIIGSGKNNFQIIYYKDLISAILFVLNNPKTENSLFIVAEEKGKILREFYSLTQKELGIKREIKTTPKFLALIPSFLYRFIGKKSILLPEHIERLVRERNYSIEKIKSLGWNPYWSTEEAVKETIKELKA